MYIALAISRFDDETEFVIAVGKYLIAFLRASKCRHVASDASLRPVYADFDDAAVFEFVSVSCLFERLLRIIMHAEFKRFVARHERQTVLSAHFEPASVGVVAVLLRNEIIVLEIRNFARINSKFCRGFSVAIILKRSSAVE